MKGQTDQQVFQGGIGHGRATGKDRHAWLINRSWIATARRHLRHKEQKERKSRDGTPGKVAERMGGPHVWGGRGKVNWVVSMGLVMADPRMKRQ